MQSNASSVSSPAEPVLHFLCGKIGAGKSTLAAQLASRPRTVLISEDAWLAALYPGEIREVADYARCAGRLRQAMGGHVAALAAAGLSVVLDFPANTRASRGVMAALAGSRVRGIHARDRRGACRDACPGCIRAFYLGGATRRGVPVWPPSRALDAAQSRHPARGWTHPFASLKAVVAAGAGGTTMGPCT